MARLWFVALLALAALLARAEDVDVEAQGTGATPAAALAEALRNAVVTAGGARIKAKATGTFAKLIEDQVLVAPSRYVPHHEVTRPAVEGPKLVSVAIKARVALDALDRELDLWAGRLAREGALPRVMIALECTVDGQVAKTSLGTIALEQAFTSTGFIVVDRATFEENRTRDLAKATAAGDVDAVARLTADAGCDVLVRGRMAAAKEAVVRVPGTAPDLRYTWNHALRAMRPGERTVVAVITQTGETRPLESHQETEADTLARGLNAEAGALGVALRRQILARWFRAADGAPFGEGATITLVLSASQMKDGDVLVPWLTSRPWVISATLDSFADGEARIRLAHRLRRCSDVASAIDKEAAADCPLGLKITGLDASTVTCQVTRR